MKCARAISVSLRAETDVVRRLGRDRFLPWASLPSSGISWTASQPCLCHCPFLAGFIEGEFKKPNSPQREQKSSVSFLEKIIESLITRGHFICKGNIQETNSWNGPSHHLNTIFTKSKRKEVCAVQIYLAFSIGKFLGDSEDNKDRLRGLCFTQWRHRHLFSLSPALNFTYLLPDMGKKAGSTWGSNTKCTPSLVDSTKAKCNMSPQKGPIFNTWDLRNRPPSSHPASA